MTNKLAEDPLVPVSKENAVLTYSQAFWNLSGMVIPNVLTAFVQCLTDFLPYYFIGLLNDIDKTGAIGLAISWFNIAAYSIILGCCSTIDTLVSQSYGNKNYKQCGTHYFRGCITVFLISFPLTFFIYFGWFFLEFFGVEARVALLAGDYLKLLIPNLFIIGQLELIKKFLNAQCIVTPTTIVTIITTCLHPIWCYLCIFKLFNGSFLGAAIAKNITTTLSLLLLILYVKCSKSCKETCVFDKKEIVASSKEWSSFICLGLASTLMLGFDWFAYEAMNMIAGNIGSVGLSANVALTNINMLIFQIPTGIGVSAGAMVGNSIGAQNIVAAKKYIKTAIFLSSIIMFSLLGILLACRKYVAFYFFPSKGSQDVIKLFEVVIFILAASEVFDMTQGTLSRILVGMRKQVAATIAIIISYYLIMLPTAFYLVFMLKMDLIGLWIANMLAAASLAFIYVVIVCRANWNEIVQEALMEAKKEIKS